MKCIIETNGAIEVYTGGVGAACQFDYLLCKPDGFRVLAGAHPDVRVIVKAVDVDTFVVLLRKSEDGGDVALGTGAEPVSLQRFRDLGDGVRTAVEVTSATYIGFDLLRTSGAET